MAISNFASELEKPYGGYSLKALVIFGWLIVVAILVVAYLLQHHKGHKYHLTGHELEED
jgi:Ni/Fe-hydrogenase subunit HybB-like protein